MSEEKFFKTTPRKYFALLECAMEMNRMQEPSEGNKKATSKAKVGYIDNIDW